MLSRLKSIRDSARALRDVEKKGGPKRVKLVRVERPTGTFWTGTEVVVEIATRDGGEVCLNPNLPVPFPYAWAYRIAHRLGVPLVSSVDPEDVSFSVPIPGWAWPGGDGPKGTKQA
jgi:hypothetical protein